MVFKKYIKRNGKTYGPYLYHNVKKDGRVTTQYLGRHEEKKVHSPDYHKSDITKGNKHVFVVGILAFVVLILAFSVFLQLGLFTTGKATSDIQGTYLEGEQLRGHVNLILKYGELIPYDTNFILDNSGDTRSFLFGDLISGDVVNGSFFVEGKNISGFGSGLGVDGEKEVFPLVDFSFKLVSGEVKSINESGNVSIGGGSGGTETSTTVDNESITQSENSAEATLNESTPQEPPANDTSSESSDSADFGNPETTTESTVPDVPPVELPSDEPPSESTSKETIESPSETPTSEDTPTDSSGETASQDAPSSDSETLDSSSESSSSSEGSESESSESSTAPVTGEVTGTDIIEGFVSKNQDYEYALPSGYSVELINSSHLVNFNVQNGKAIFTTDYSEIEKGFGKDYLTNDEVIFPINLSNLNLSAKEGTLTVSFVYNDVEITSSSKEITVTAQNKTNMTKQEKLNSIVLNKRFKIDGRIIDKLLVQDKVRVLIKTKPGKTSIGQKLSGLGGFEVIELDENNIDLLNDTNVSEIIFDQPVNLLVGDSESIIRSVQARDEFNLAGAGKKICIIDTGVEGSVTNYSTGFDFVNNDSDATDDNGHGTQVAYIAKIVAPGADLIVVKALDENGNGYESNVLEGLQYCIDNNADIISLSIGAGGYNGYCDDNFVAQLVNTAVDSGIFVAAATGNDGSTSLKSPACASKVTRVSATDKQDNIASFSNVNEVVDVFAPGENIDTMGLSGQETISGTSASVPFVSGAAALVLENEDIPPLNLTYRFASTGKPIEYNGINISRLDVYNAIINNITMIPYNGTLNQSNVTEEPFEILSGPLSVSLNSPQNGYTIPSASDINFSCTGNGGAGIMNISLYHNVSGAWVLNQTKDYSGFLVNVSNHYYTVYNGDGTFTTTFQPDGSYGKDAYVSDTNPTTNYGGDTSAFFSSGSFQPERETLLEFNLSTIPQLASIVYANLTFNVQDWSAYIYADVRRITQLWYESNVTWNYNPSNDPYDYTNPSQYIASTGYYSLNVTPLVNEWHTGTYPNYGMKIVSATSQNGLAEIYSSDDVGSTTRPKLSVTYVIPDQTANFTVPNISYGDYAWNCMASDINGSSVFASSNYTFDVDPCLPPTSGDWNIESGDNCILADKTLEVASGSKLKVKNGGSLILVNSTLITSKTVIDMGGVFKVKNSKGTIWQNGNLEINGTFVLQNSTLRMNGTGTNGTIGINVTSGGNVTINESSVITNGNDGGYRYFFLVETGSNFSMKDSSLSHGGWGEISGQRGLEIYVPVNLSGNTFTDSFSGATLYSNGNNISNNSFLRMVYSIRLSSKKNTIGNNFFENSTLGVFLYYTDSDNTDNLIFNNTFIRTGGLLLLSTDFYERYVNDRILFNTISYSDLSLEGALTFYGVNHLYNITLSNNTLENNSNRGISQFGGSTSSISRSVISNNRIKNNTGGIYSYSSSFDNLFLDNVIEDISSGYDLSFEGVSTNNTFLNTTFNKSNAFVASGSSIFVQWYLDVNVTDIVGNPINNANVSAWNTSGVIGFSDNSTLDGSVPQKVLTEYMQNSTGKSFWTNYTLNTVAFGYSDYSSQLNLTGSTKLNILMQCGPPLSGDWNLTSPCTLINHSVSLPQNGDLNINNGGSLTLINSTILLNSTGDGNSGIHVYNGGNINITSGSLINTTNPVYEFFFTVDSGSNFSMTNSRLERAGWLASSDSGLRINTTVVNFSGNYFKYVNKLSLLSDNNTFYNNTLDLSTIGLDVYGSKNNITNNSLINGFGAGLTLESSSKNNSVFGNFINNNDRGIIISTTSTGNYLLSNRIIFNDNEGIYLTGYGNFIEGGNITQNSKGVGFVYGFAPYSNVVKGVFLNNYQYDLYSASTFSFSKGNLFVLNSTFNHSKVSFHPNSIDDIFVQWYLDVNVTNEEGIILPGSNVTAWNVFGNIQFSTLTDGNGLIPSQNITEYVRNVTGKYVWNNYTLNVTKQGYVNYTDALNITGNIKLNVTLGVNYPPVVSNVNIFSIPYGEGSSAENLSVSYLTTDIDNTGILTNITDWKRNGISIAVLNMPFDKNVSKISEKIRDYSDFENNGTLGNGAGSFSPTWAKNQCIVGGCFNFNDDVIIIPDSPSLSSFREMTIMLWFNSTTGDQNGLVEKYDSTLGGRNGYVLRLNDSHRLEFYVIDNAGLDKIAYDQVIANNQWYHVAAVLNSTGTMKIYLNGSLVKTGTTLRVVTDGSTSLKVGARGDVGDKRFDGMIDEVQVYNKSLSSEQIFYAYQQGLAGKSIEKIVSNETKLGENWSVSVTPNDGRDDGNTLLSGNLTIVNVKPSVYNTLLQASSPSNTTLDNLSVSYNSNDIDGDAVTVVSDWRVNGSSISLLNLPFDTNVSGVGGILRDYSTFGNNGTLGWGILGTAPTWNSSGKIGGTYYFDGIDDVINVSMSQPSTPFTVETWIKSAMNHESSGNNFGVLAKALDPSWSWQLRFGGADSVTGNSDNLGFQFNNGSGVSNSIWVNVNQMLTIGQWYHVVGTYNGTYASIYLNGVLNETKPLNTVQSSSTHLIIGNDGWTNFFNGTIDEVKIWNRSLSTEQIKENYQAGLAVHSPEKIVSNETRIGDIWTVALTPNDAKVDGATALSNNVTILNGPPIVTLISPSNFVNITTRMPTFNWSGFDPDGDSLTYEFKIIKYSSGPGGVCADLRSNVVMVAHQYTVDPFLKCLSEDGHYYNWTVRASDDGGVNWGSWASERRLDISVLVALNLTTPFVDFGVVPYTGGNDTIDNNPNPLIVENIGNVFVNVSINATNLWQIVSNPNLYYQFKVDNVTGEEGSFDSALSQITWDDVPNETLKQIMSFFNWTDNKDSAEIDIKIQVPPMEPGGEDRQSTIYFIATRSDPDSGGEFLLLP